MARDDEALHYFACTIPADVYRDLLELFDQAGRKRYPYAPTNVPALESFGVFCERVVALGLGATRRDVRGR